MKLQEEYDRLHAYTNLVANCLDEGEFKARTRSSQPYNFIDLYSRDLTFPSGSKCVPTALDKPIYVLESR